MTRARSAATWLAAWLPLFALAALLNSGGYRYGASDQAFYIPAVARHADQSLFPRDWPLLAAQDRFNVFTPLAGWAVATLGLSLPALFFAMYVATILVLGAAGLALGWLLAARDGSRPCPGGRWTAAAVLMALTLRHAVALGAVNTLEGYAHPRMLAFGIGVLSLAALLAARPWTVVLLVALSGLVHPTTGIWFAVVAGVGLMVAHRSWRPWLAGAAILAAGASAWALLFGPLSGRMARMDEEWLAVLGSRRYLFPDLWPASEWLIVLACLAVILFAFWRRARAGFASPHERGLAAGLLALAAALALTLPPNAARIAFFVQLQAPRVLWILDLAAVACLAWLLADGGRLPVPSPRRARAVALAILAASLARGAYVSFVEHPERALVRLDLPGDDWNRALRWIEARTPRDAFVLADPGHAWRNGTSVRVGAKRDVLLEEVKDGAMAMYGRESASRVLDRIRALQGFDGLTPDQARRLAARYGLTVLIAQRDMDLPLLTRQGRFRVYSLAPADLKGTTFYLLPSAFSGGYRIPSCSRYVSYFDGS